MRGHHYIVNQVNKSTMTECIVIIYIDYTGHKEKKKKKKCIYMSEQLDQRPLCRALSRPKLPRQLPLSIACVL